MSGRDQQSNILTDALARLEFLSQQHWYPQLAPLVPIARDAISPPQPIAWGCFHADGRLCFDLVGTKEDCEYWRDDDSAYEKWTVRPIYG